MTPPTAALQRHVSIRQANDSVRVLRTLMLWREWEAARTGHFIVLLVSLGIAFSIPKQ